ncbi:MAG: phosphoribosyl-AMP cyclohydrolase [Hyphomicrobiaceae bacterium]|nr:phosphoribosyl-AMP cyclohydrolase [Hyphomicrobiaceae bacterium]
MTTPEHRETLFARTGSFAEIEDGLDFQPLFDASGLIPAIVSDAATGEVLMFAHMNRDALRLTLETGLAHFYSRSRKRLWKKGEDSGNTLSLVAIATDCDQDVVWLRVRIDGVGAACHTGRRSCFYRTIPFGTPESARMPRLVMAETPPLFDPAAVYGGKSG